MPSVANLQLNFLRKALLLCNKAFLLSKGAICRLRLVKNNFKRQWLCAFLCKWARQEKARRLVQRTSSAGTFLYLIII